MIGWSRSRRRSITAVSRQSEPAFEGADCVFAEQGCVFGFRGEASDGSFDVMAGELFQGSDVPCEKELGEGGTGSDGGGTTSDFVAGFHYTTVLCPYRKAEDVSTYGVGHFDGDGRFGKVADVARVAEMVDQFRTHCASIVRTIR